MHPRHGLATVRTRSGHVVNPWVVAGTEWALLLAPATLATWWAHHHGIDSPELWLAAPVALLFISLAVAFTTLAWEFVLALRQVSGHAPRAPREPWLSFSSEDEGTEPEPWEIPKLW